MHSNQRDLELLLIGAILVDPELKSQIEGFSDRSLAEVLDGLNSGKIAPIIRFLNERNVTFPSGKGEAIKGIVSRQKVNWVLQEIAEANLRLLTATKLQHLGGITREVERIKWLESLLPKEKPKPAQQQQRKIVKPPPPATPERNSNESHSNQNQKPTARSAEVPDRAGSR